MGIYSFITDEKGLSVKEVQNIQEKHGLNVLPEKPPPSKASIFLSQLKSPLVYVLLVASLVTFAINHIADALIILLAVLINTILGFIQENKTSKSLSALKKFISETVNVIRDGEKQSIETKYIVPGDIVILNQGDKVPADGIIMSSNRLYVNEAMLTGESMPVEKKDRDGIFMGTNISSGQSVMQVESIGENTQMGKIALKVQEEIEETPLQKQLKTFSKQLILVILMLIVIVFVAGLFHQITLVDLFTTSVALAVSSIPEGLLVSLTVVLAIGMQKILKRKGLVRRLAAAETLGGVSVICIDKTGTLTQGKMEVIYNVGDGKELAKQSILANDLDDPIVITSYDWAKNILDGQLPNHTRIDSIPFSSKERFFICLNKWNSKNNMIFVNGAPEMLLKWTTLSSKEKSDILLSIENLTKQGKRVVGYARKEVSVKKEVLYTEDAKSNLEWVGVLIFSDPIREGIKESLEITKKAGIKTIVITGDYANTSKYVLSELGIDVSSDEIMTGDELSSLSKRDLEQRVKRIKLFARTTPDQKLLIVEALKKNGEVVAMIGDGVNDAPALHNSDIGVVVGNASDVSKESADLVLLDSNFSTIVSAIEEGRVMFENIRKIILYLLCDAFEEILVVLGGIILGLPLPVTAVQILWINLVSDGFPNLSLTIDPKRADIMSDRPRPSKEHLVNKRMLFLIGFVSILAGLIALFSFIITYNKTGDVVLARSVTFITIGLNSLIYVFSIREPKNPFWKDNLFKNQYLVLAVFAGLFLQALPFVTNTTRQFFGLSKLHLNHWLLAFALSIFMFLLIEVFKHFNKSKLTS